MHQAVIVDSPRFRLRCGRRLRVLPLMVSIGARVQPAGRHGTSNPFTSGNYRSRRGRIIICSEVVRPMADLRVDSGRMVSAFRRAWRWVTHGPAQRWALDVALGVIAAYVAVILTVEFYGGLVGACSVGRSTSRVHVWRGHHVPPRRASGGGGGAGHHSGRVCRARVAGVRVGSRGVGHAVHGGVAAVTATCPDPAGCCRRGDGRPTAARNDRAFHVGAVCGHLVRRLVPRRCHAPVAGCGDRTRCVQRNWNRPAPNWLDSPFRPSAFALPANCTMSWPTV